jgi:hypothetical protein
MGGLRFKTWEVRSLKLVVELFDFIKILVQIINKFSKVGKMKNKK